MATHTSVPIHSTHTLTTARVAVELWARVWITSRGGSRLRLSICDCYVKM